MSYPQPLERKVNRNLATDLKKAIKQSGKTHYRIAADAGIRPAIIDRFMSGERDMRLTTAAKVATALGLVLSNRRK
jgi:DNA-binding phage protein